ncbi:MAG: methyltransferase [Planctomycetota bacterium]
MNNSNPIFRFQRFSIADDLCGMKIGTDAVLLGAWADVSDANRILDIGTGCGIIALMLAQRTENINAQIDAVDFENASATQANLNFLHSPWPGRISGAHQSLQELAVKQKAVYDLCVCNPPYFQNGSTSTDPKKKLARHAQQLSRAELFINSKSLLRPEGRLCIIIPSDQECQTIALASRSGFYLKKQLSVKPLPSLPVKRVLLEFNQSHSISEKAELIIETKRHEFSLDYEALTKNFHLRFA